jgi:hypothetical protein
MCRGLCIAILALAGQISAQQLRPVTINPGGMPKVGAVDSRFVSYNIEMVEVTGGRFWKPYADDTGTDEAAKAATPNSNPNAGLDPSVFQYRPPIDLTNVRLRNLAKGVGPAYVRVSGAWANRTYFQDDDNPPLKQPPAGFDDVLTRAEWKGVIEFARAVGAQIVSSFAISSGTRDANSVWMPTQAEAFVRYTKAVGGQIAAAEFMNEPNLATRQGAPAGYDAAAFARDIKVFSPLLRSELPGTLLLGPGGVGEGGTGVRPANSIDSEDILKATGSIFDLLSYHFYGALSRRCTARGRGRGVTLDQVLSPEWLDRTNQVEAFYAALRDTYLPSKPIWVTETAEAACGGDKFSGQFADTFRFLNQFGTLARKSVKVVMHNTLAASDYGLLDEKTFEPRPNYWAAVLWNRAMGTTVLDPRAESESTLRIYAHCMKQGPGGVAVLALNTDEKEEHTLDLSVSGERLTLTAPALTSTSVILNGRELKARADGSLPAIQGLPFKPGTVRLPPHSITFITMRSAGNSNCR